VRPSISSPQIIPTGILPLTHCDKKLAAVAQAHLNGTRRADSVYENLGSARLSVSSLKWAIEPNIIDIHSQIFRNKGLIFLSQQSPREIIVAFSGVVHDLVQVNVPIGPENKTM
jgi:hypothetical protein